MQLLHSRQLPELGRGAPAGAGASALAPSSPQRLLAQFWGMGIASPDEVFGRHAGLLAGLLSFFAFIPYPALNVGSTSAIQIGNVLVLVMCFPIVAMPWRGRPFWILPAIMAPLLFSCTSVAMLGTGDPGLAMKSVIAFAIAVIALLATQMYAPRHANEMLTGIAIATIIHSIVGAVQCYSFSQGVFPFEQVYINQSFLSVQDNAERIARYTQRPFGLFPEPSAMSSSLAPFVLFWIAMSCGLVKLKREPARWQRILFHLATVGALALLLLSRSGHCAVTLAAAVCFGANWLWRCKATFKTYLILIIVFGVVMPGVLYLAAQSLSDRIGGDDTYGNSSWEERSSSLRIGFEMLSDGGIATMLMGLGVGQSSPAMWKVARIDSVFSVLLVYIYETGLIGMAAVLGIGAYLARVWQSIGRSVPFAAIVFVWLVGVTLTTSYSQLLPLWIALGWLSVWPEICRRANEA